MAELANLLGLAWDDRLAAAVDHADGALQSGRPAPFAAADLVTGVHAVRPDAEPLAWLLADLLIAALLNCSIDLLIDDLREEQVPDRTGMSRTCGCRTAGKDCANPLPRIGKRLPVCQAAAFVWTRKSASRGMPVWAPG